MYIIIQDTINMIKYMKYCVIILVQLNFVWNDIHFVSPIIIMKNIFI